MKILWFTNNQVNLNDKVFGDVACAALGKPMVMTVVGGNVDQMPDLPDTLGCEVANPIQLSLSIKSAVEKFRSDPKWGYRNKLAFDSTFGVKEFAKRWDDAAEEIVSLN